MGSAALFLFVIVISIIILICKGDVDENINEEINDNRNSNNNINDRVYISGQSLKIISVAFGLFGILFIANSIMCCYNCYAFSLYWNKRKHHVTHFNDDDHDDYDHYESNYGHFRVNTFG